ncbi:MAG: O-antigen ligase family protein [Polyangiaceae bacterium]|nr:O-antigen ligase family protein [Polyangiaceae bacterium]
MQDPVLTLVSRPAEPRGRAGAPWWWREQRPPRSSVVPVVALGAFTFVLLTAPQTTFPVLASLRIALLTAGLAIAAHLVDRVARGQSVLALPRGTWPAVLLGLWAIATAPLSAWPGGSVDLFLDLFVKSLLVLWLIAGVVDTTRRLRGLFWLLSALGVMLAVTALGNFATGKHLAGGAPGLERIAGFDAPLTANPNDLALVLNLLLPLSLSLYHAHRRPGVRVLLLGVMALEVAGVVATFSRAGFLTLLVVAVAHVLSMLRGARRIWGAVGIAGALVLVAVLPGGYGQHLGTVTDISSDPTGSAQERWTLMGAALRVVMAHPVCGVGLGMNILAITDDVGGWRMVHNVYLQVAADLGLVGLALFLALFLGCWRHLRTLLRERAGLGGARAGLAHLARGIELSLLAFGVAALFHPAAYHFYVFYVGGLALAARGIHDREVAHG